MTVPSRQAVASLLFAATTAAFAQTPTPTAPTAPAPRPRTPTQKPPAVPAARPAPPYLNHNLIFLDPAHGGSDPGAHLPNNLVEKDITLALASRIRTLLAGNNLSILLSREADAPPAPADEADQPPASTPIVTPTPDARAGAANHVHPVACILLHATASGNGVHIVTSALAPSPDTSLDLPPSPSRPIPWESAQTDSIPKSLRLANEIGAAIARANLPVHLSRASVKPIDSLTCTAVAIEIAPLLPAARASSPTPVSDPAYQQRVAQAVATALLFWRGHADPPPPPTLSPTSDSSNPGSSTPGSQR